MATLAFVDASGRKSKVDAPDAIFGVDVNVHAMHEAVKAELAAARTGTHSTKTRAEVRGGGRKPWRQKGTGRARHGSIREPQWVGGGIAHGPKPRDYSMRLNRKVRALALRSALTDRARAGQVVVVELPAFPEPETKRAVELLGWWGATGKTLLVLGHPGEQANVWKSFRNLPNVLSAPRPTTYTVLAADTVVFTRQTLGALSGDETAASVLPEPPGPGPVPVAGSSVPTGASGSPASTGSAGAAGATGAAEGAGASGAAEAPGAAGAPASAGSAGAAGPEPSAEPVPSPEGGA